LETVNQILMISVTFEHFKGRHNKSILLLNKLLQKLHIVGVLEIVLCKTVHVVHKLVLSDGKWALRSFVVVDLLLCESD
jgi:hypothetical protein